MNVKGLIVVGIIIVGIIAFLTIAGNEQVNSSPTLSVEPSEEVMNEEDGQESSADIEESTDSDSEEVNDGVAASSTSLVATSTDDMSEEDADMLESVSIEPELRNQYGNTDVFSGGDYTEEELQSFCEAGGGEFNSCGPSQCSENEDGEFVMCTRDCALTCTY